MELTLRTLPRVLHKTQTVSCPRISLCHTRLFQNGVNEKSLVAARLSTKSDIVAERTLFQMLPVVYWQTDRHMAGHSKFSNIKHRKEAQDSKKSALMGQYVKLAQSAVKNMRKPYRASDDVFDVGNLVSTNPIQQFEAWFNEARAVPNIGEANAMALATASKSGFPSVRMVLMKGFSEKGFTFFTNYESRKAAELELLQTLSADSESESAEWACAPDFKVPTPSRQMEMPFHLSLPSVDVSEISSAFRPNYMDNLKEVTLEEQEFGEEECEIEVENESEEMKEDTGPGVIKLTITEDIKILTEDFTCLVYRRQHRTFNKKSGRWSVSPVKVDKSYNHIHILQERIVEARLNDQQDPLTFLGLPRPRLNLGSSIRPTGLLQPPPSFSESLSEDYKKNDENPVCSLMFYWDPMKRSVRIEGTVERVPEEESLHYFEQRPRKSRLGAIVSHQSTILESREVINQKYADLLEEYKDEEKNIPKPDYWGGYLVRPISMEFWQGQTNRLHDRIRFHKLKENEAIDSKCMHQGDRDWVFERLAP
uniref:pyridoxal 5'-phosphate synthase n=2 Tax=Magallana gigas TaxID=29159 RepID=K1QPQ6_MAGGI